MAVGLSLKKENFDKFKKEFEEYAKANIDENLEPELDIDLELDSKDLNSKQVADLSLLEPFGDSNYEPIFLIKNLKITSIRTLSEDKHIKLNLKNEENISIDAIGFNMGDLANKFLIGDKVDIVGNLQINNFNGVSSVQVVLKDMRTSL